MKRVILIVNGNAYMLADPSRPDGGGLMGAPILANGDIEREGGPESAFNWFDVDFSRGLDPEQEYECRQIEAALVLIQGASVLHLKKRE